MPAKTPRWSGQDPVPELDRRRLLGDGGGGWLLRGSAPQHQDQPVLGRVWWVRRMWWVRGLWRLRR